MYQNKSIFQYVSKFLVKSKEASANSWNKGISNRFKNKFLSLEMPICKGTDYTIMLAYGLYSIECFKSFGLFLSVLEQSNNIIGNFKSTTCANCYP